MTLWQGPLLIHQLLDFPCTGNDSSVLLDATRTVEINLGAAHQWFLSCSPAPGGLPIGVEQHL